MKSEPSATRTAAHELIEFAHALAIDSVPASIVDNATWCLLDSLGCGLFGSQQPWAKIMADEMFAESSRGRSTVFGRSLSLAAAAAALCNGTSSHGFELDDLLDEAIVHPGAIIIPAALAAAESVDASGARLLLGIIAGYEAMSRIGLALGMEPAHRGFHKTSVAGPAGAAIGAGGGMMKRMHCGRPAEAGVRMAQLAQRGFTGPPTALDGRFGLLEVFGGQTARADLLASN